MPRAIILTAAAVSALLVVNNRESAVHAYSPGRTSLRAFAAGDASDPAVLSDALAPERIHTSDMGCPVIRQLHDQAPGTCIHTLPAVEALFLIDYRYSAYN